MNIGFDLHELPQSVRMAVGPLMEELPPERAMAALVVDRPLGLSLTKLAEDAAADLDDPSLRAGIWLYVDELDASHRISQGVSSSTGSYWHAIMHRREGDFSNSKYWLRHAGSHPVWERIPGFDPVRFVDQVEARHQARPAELIDLQRREWWEFFLWCAENSARKVQSGEGEPNALT